MSSILNRFRGSSPHTRGALDQMIVAELEPRIIPAYAGSTGSSSPSIRFVFSLDPHFAGSSPHTRGALRFRRVVLERVRIIPAYAGSTVRGKIPRLSRRIIPAYAGSTAGHATISNRTQDHPRIRGEHHALSHPKAVRGGSSPHTRGAPLHGDRVDVHPGIIPAYAGSTPMEMCRCPSSRDHPRIRGEHDGSARISRVGGGSSPHTRGAPVCAISARRRLRIIPAYAGSTWRVSGHARGCRDHPRIRGEHKRVGGFLPRSAWIIPAYAGSTPSSTLTAS